MGFLTNLFNIFFCVLPSSPTTQAYFLIPGKHSGFQLYPCNCDSCPSAFRLARVWCPGRARCIRCHAHPLGFRAHAACGPSALALVSHSQCFYTNAISAQPFCGVCCGVELRERAKVAVPVWGWLGWLAASLLGGERMPALPVAARQGRAGSARGSARCVSPGPGEEPCCGALGCAGPFPIAELPLLPPPPRRSPAAPAAAAAEGPCPGSRQRLKESRLLPPSAAVSAAQLRCH